MSSNDEHRPPTTEEFNARLEQGLPFRRLPPMVSGVFAVLSTVDVVVVMVVVLVFVLAMFWRLVQPLVG